MKTRILLISLAFLVTVTAVLSADAEYDDYVEEEPAPAPPPKPVPARGVAALQRPRVPLIGRATPKTQPPPKSTTEAPVENYDEDAPVEDEVPEEDVTTTTEAPKKSAIRGGVRPFRSNADLIEALKRRRQMQNGGSATHTTTTTTSTPTEKSYKSNKRGSGSNKINNGAVSDQAGSDSQRKSTVNGRRFNPRGNPNKETTEQPIQEEVAEETQPSRSRTFGRGRRF